jgi:hypothetical protein
LGWLLRRHPFIVGGITGILSGLAAFGNSGMGMELKMLPLFFICVCLGWLAAFVLGATIVRSAPGEAIVDRNVGPEALVPDR